MSRAAFALFGAAFAVLLCLPGWAAPARASDSVGPAEALTLVHSRAAAFVDIRTPIEWQDTGLPSGAAAISWGRPDFAERVLALVQGDRAAPLVLICRTGNRSGKAMAYLRDQGFGNVRHVPEGMVGSAAGPGWIARGLPTVDWSGN